MKITSQNITKLDHSNSGSLTHNEINKISGALANTGFIFLPGQTLYDLLLNEALDLHERWSDFQESWNHLKKDTFMADGGDYRLRRHAIYAIPKHSEEIAPAPYMPHYQSLDHNSLNGGVARHFSPLGAATRINPVFMQILALCRDVVCAVAPGYAWHVEVHQFRIETAGAGASPTPEGLHRDGVDYVFMMMIRRRHISGGITSLCSPCGELVCQHTFTQEMEAAFIDDTRLLHGVSAIEPVTAGTRGYRDMLVITFCKA